jgi:hypothetical protein
LVRGTVGVGTRFAVGGCLGEDAHLAEQRAQSGQRGGKNAEGNLEDGAVE